MAVDFRMPTGNGRAGASQQKLLQPRWTTSSISSAAIPRKSRTAAISTSFHSQEIDGHQTRELFEWQTVRGEGPQLKAFVAQALPAVPGSRRRIWGRPLGSIKPGEGDP
jgi:hypothetical protein